MKKDEILKCVKIEDIHEDWMLLIRNTPIDENYLKHRRYYVGDGLDYFRHLVNELDGLSLKVPRLNKLRAVQMRYMSERIKENPGISIAKLAYEMGIGERTVYEYMKDLNIW